MSHYSAIRARLSSRRSLGSLAGGLIMALALVGCGAPSAVDFNTRGNELYDQGIYGQALPQYKEAVGLAPDRVEPNVNLGNTRYQLGDYLGAVEAPKDVLKNADPLTQATIYYNQGNAYYRLNELDQAIDSYKEALRRNPGDVDAKYNLELAQRTQEQQQQQQQAGGQGQQQPQQPQDGQQPQDPQNGQGDQQPQDPQDGQGGQQQRPDLPPSSLTPDEAERQLDQLRRSEGRRNDELYDNYAVGGDQGDQDGNRPTDNGW